MDVAVLIGGASPEHDVSLASGAKVLEHLDRERWQVWPVLIGRDGYWHVNRQPLVAGEVWTIDDCKQMHGPLRPGAAMDWLLDCASIDVAFPMLHGPFGEDGTVQGLLELNGLPFVGSGCGASAVAMDKLRTRQVYRSAEIAIPDGYEPTMPFDKVNACVEFAAMNRAIGMPAFVKVDASGSTVGVARITKESELADFLLSFRGQFRRWYAEQAVVGEEITVAVLGNAGRNPQALPPIGIYPVDDDWFTHDAKYRPGATEEIIPPRGLSDAMIQEVQQLAIRCHELLVCDGYSRTDMIVTADGPVVIETNTIPGMTESSLFPRASAAAGIKFPRLMDRLLELALERPSLIGGSVSNPLIGEAVAHHDSAANKAASGGEPSDRGASISQ